MKLNIKLNRNKLFLFSFVVALLGINAWSITTIAQPSKPQTEVKGIETRTVKKISSKPSIAPSIIVTKNARTTQAPNPTKKPATLTQNAASGKSDTNTAISNNTGSQSSTQTSPQSTTAPTTATSNPVTPNSPKPTIIVVMHPGSGGASVQMFSGNVQPVYVTPTPNTGSFEAAFSYNSSNGQGTITANKPIRECDGVQKNTKTDENGITSTETKGALKTRPRWGCPDGKCSYICEVYFAPPNTYAYDWPHGAKVISEQGEEKTFGNW